MAKMKIHIQSDTHVEGRGPIMEPSVISDVMVCCGDIGLVLQPSGLRDYFNKCREYTDEIIWVLGNHEYYHGEYSETLVQAEKFAKEEGIHLMDQALGTDNLELNGVTFWGSTLWTDMKGGDPISTITVDRGLNDHHVIRQLKQTEEGGTMRFTAEDAMAINTITRSKINWDADVVITHHCPILTEHKRFPISDITYGFCNTGLEEQIAASNIKYWIYGHTHDSKYIDVNGTGVISNQHGYSSKGWDGSAIYEDSDYDPSLILEI